MARSKGEFFNASACPDPTAYYALREITKEEKELEKKVHNLVNVLKFIVEWAGFEFVGRIQIRDKKSGKVFR